MLSTQADLRYYLVWLNKDGTMDYRKYASIGGAEYAADRKHEPLFILNENLDVLTVCNAPDDDNILEKVEWGRRMNSYMEAFKELL